MDITATVSVFSSVKLHRTPRMRMPLLTRSYCNKQQQHQQQQHQQHKQMGLVGSGSPTRPLAAATSPAPLRTSICLRMDATAFDASSSGLVTSVG